MTGWLSLPGTEESPSKYLLEQDELIFEEGDIGQAPRGGRKHSRRRAQHRQGRAGLTRDSVEYRAGRQRAWGAWQCRSGRPLAGRKSCASSRGGIHWDVCSRKVTSTVTVTGDGEVILDLEQDDDGPDRVRLQDGATSLLGRGWEEGSAGLMTYWRGSRWG